MLNKWKYTRKFEKLIRDNVDSCHNIFYEALKVLSQIQRKCSLVCLCDGNLFFRQSFASVQQQKKIQNACCAFLFGKHFLCGVLKKEEKLEPRAAVEVERACKRASELRRYAAFGWQVWWWRARARCKNKRRTWPRFSSSSPSFIKLFEALFDEPEKIFELRRVKIRSEHGQEKQAG